jgi:hypothetical protein
MTTDAPRPRSVCADVRHQGRVLAGLAIEDIIWFEEGPISGPLSRLVDAVGTMTMSSQERIVYLRIGATQWEVVDSRLVLMRSLLTKYRSAIEERRRARTNPPEATKEPEAPCR